MMGDLDRRARQRAAVADPSEFGCAIGLGHRRPRQGDRVRRRGGRVGDERLEPTETAIAIILHSNVGPTGGVVFLRVEDAVIGKNADVRLACRLMDSPQGMPGFEIARIPEMGGELSAVDRIVKYPEIGVRGIVGWNDFQWRRAGGGAVRIGRRELVGSEVGLIGRGLGSRSRPIAPSIARSPPAVRPAAPHNRKLRLPWRRENRHM